MGVSRRGRKECTDTTTVVIDPTKVFCIFPSNRHEQWHTMVLESADECLNMRKTILTIRQKRGKAKQLDTVILSFSSEPFFAWYY